MTQEERNEWLLKNMDIITSTIHRYCEKHDDYDYDETYMDIVEYLIKKLDGQYGDELIDIPKHKITQIVGNRVRAFNLQIKPTDNEDLHDPSDFEELYFPDFDGTISFWEISEASNQYLTEREQSIFDKYITGDYTLEDLSKEYSLTTERIRQIWLKACRKIFLKKIFRIGVDQIYFKLRIRGAIHYKDNWSNLSGFVIVKAFDRKTAQLRSINVIKNYIQEKHGVDACVTIRSNCVVRVCMSASKKDTESVEIEYDDSIFTKEPPRKQKPEYIDKPGYLITYNIEFEYSKSSSDNLYVRESKELQLIADSEQEAYFYIMNHANGQIIEKARSLKIPINDVHIIKPTCEDHINLKPVIYRRLK